MTASFDVSALTGVIYRWSRVYRFGEGDGLRPDRVGEFTYVTFFPEALAIDEARMPSRRALVQACEAAGFVLRGQ